MTETIGKRIKVHLFYTLEDIHTILLIFYSPIHLQVDEWNLDILVVNSKVFNELPGSPHQTLPIQALLIYM